MFLLLEISSSFVKCVNYRIPTPPYEETIQGNHPNVLPRKKPIFYCNIQNEYAENRRYNQCKKIIKLSMSVLMTDNECCNYTKQQEVQTTQYKAKYAYWVGFGRPCSVTGRYTNITWDKKPKI